MKDYKQETLDMIAEISDNLISKKQMFVEEIDIGWKVEKVSNGGENKCDHENLFIDILVPNVKIKIK